MPSCPPLPTKGRGAVGRRAPPASARMDQIGLRNRPTVTPGYTIVANSTNQGTNSVNTTDGVLSNSNPPPKPPRMLTSNSALNGSLPAPVTSLRPASPEVTCPGNNATVEVMFAAKITKEPPVAREFCNPAQTAACWSLGGNLGAAPGQRKGSAYCYLIAGAGAEAKQPFQSSKPCRPFSACSWIG